MRFSWVMLALAVGCTDGGDDEDFDGDGVTADLDCDDGNPAAFPGNPETCDGIDNDCNGVVDDEASDALTWYADTDSDGFGDLASTVLACTAPAGTTDDATDCDDSDWLVNPAGIELCDLIDNDCNDVVDDAADGDGDGLGACDDCNDDDGEIYTGAEEFCDEIDNDCDGEIDEFATGLGTWYADTDGDGHGDPAVEYSGCEQPTDHVELDDDCDDGDATVYTGATELCDGLDNNCDTVTDEGNDVDADTYDDVCGGDCDDDNDAINPGAVEICDGVDNNCSGTADDSAVNAAEYFADTDADTYGDPDSSVFACEQPSNYVSDSQDCDDADGAINPDATETCDDVDQDCDESVDEGLFSTYYADTDGDGFGDASASSEFCADPGTGYAVNPADCDDSDGAINPGGTEVCDGTADEDCDSAVDEGLTTTYYTDGDGDGFGDEGSGADFCSDPGTGYADNEQDCDDGNAGAYPFATETCDGIDEDCDDTADEGLPSVTYYTDGDGDGYGDPDDSLTACSDPGTGYTTDDQDCDDSLADVNPDGTETCDGTDEDCDDVVDNGLATTTYYTDGDGDGYGEDGTDTDECSDPGTGYATADGDCDDGDGSVNPGQAEVCNDWVDNDCDGTDNGCTPTGSIALADADAVIVPDGSGTNGASQMGWRVAGGGDVDGDGLDDVVCTARADASGGGAGAGWVYTDPNGSLLASDAYGQLVSGTGGETLGNGAALGDLDDDGSADVILGTTGTDTVYVWYGPLATATAAPDATITGSGTFGTAVASGDVDGDGFDDLVVGAQTYSGSGLSSNGAVYLFLGPIVGDLTDADADAVFDGEVGGDAAGGEVAVGGDLLGNGGATILIGAKGNDTNGTDAGAVYVVDGSTTGALNLSLADAIFYGSTGGDDLWDAHDAGDVDDDGSTDLILGVSDDETSGSASGSAAVFFGPVSGTQAVSAADFVVTGQASADKFGYAATGAGDFNGDGYDDIIVGAYGDESPAHNSGSAYIVYGPVTAGTLGAASADVQLGGAEDDQAGLSVAGAFDANGDGYDDVIVGSWKDDGAYTDAGACYVIYGGGI